MHSSPCMANCALLRYVPYGCGVLFICTRACQSLESDNRNAPHFLYCVTLYSMKMVFEMKTKGLLFIFLFLSLSLSSQTVDYSVVSVPEETGLELVKITSENDNVAMPLVRRIRTGINWTANRVLDVSKDGKRLAFISSRGEATNIFVREISGAGSSTQRTNRTGVTGFSYSPDGKSIVFSETIGKNSQIFQTDAEQGFVCRQITSGNLDYAPVYTDDMSSVFFARQENRGFSLWSYDLQNHYLSSYSSGLTPCYIGDNTLVCTRINAEGRGEIWKIDYSSGIEECIISDRNISFSTPLISPNGKWLVFVGGSSLEAKGRVYYNTDIYVCQLNGEYLMQLTYHAADDISPVWSVDGKYIYFISQRGSAEAVANVWRLTCPVL